MLLLLVLLPLLLPPPPPPPPHIESILFPSNKESRSSSRAERSRRRKGGKIASKKVPPNAFDELATPGAVDSTGHFTLVAGPREGRVSVSNAEVVFRRKNEIFRRRNQGNLPPTRPPLDLVIMAVFTLIFPFWPRLARNIHRNCGPLESGPSRLVPCKTITIDSSSGCSLCVEFSLAQLGR